MARKRSETREELKARLQDTEDRVREQYERMRVRMQDYGDRLDDNVRTHPRESVAVAFGIGLLAGAMLAGSMRRR